MAVPQEQFDEWEAQVNSANMLDVLNAMLAISECEFDNPADRQKAVVLLEKAGSNLHSMAKQTKLTLPEGRLTFEEFRQRCLAKVKHMAAPAGKTESQRELDERLMQFETMASQAPDVSTEDIESGKALLRSLYQARERSQTTPPQDIYAQVKGVRDVRRAEDADASQSYGGQFAYCLELVDDPECRGLLSRVMRGRRTALSDEFYDMRRIRRFWVRDVRPQQFAFRRLELLETVSQLPTDGWTVGPV